MAPILSLLLLGASTVIASPARVARQQQSVTVSVTQTAEAPGATPWDQGAVREYPIHSSCNHTERAQIARGLQETIILSQHAKDHINRWGNSSDIYVKYFGNASTGSVTGWYDKIVNGDKAGILFRCDNPDGNCAQEGWAGHWRGANATSETVICPLSYEVRKPLEAMCGFGYNVANFKTNFYWGSDLLHRLFHVPKVGEGAVEHYAGHYDEVLELAETNPEEASKNSDTLQYFALEAYAFDIAVPGEGCAGKFTATSSAAPPPATSSAAASTAAASATVAPPASATSEAAPEKTCEPHDDHWHCPPGVPEPTAPPA
ncbi:zincin [Aaosphaeria arxii CBS 175.79]|uniref:Zincin n=1 Tax=Aaosphaeria arxii CBS 175.79 TaxID=1450172 RepID=A0A6A5XQF5_9PLEO|nr:zincin [Aaosphaeria arxii CBS 175.79]KAF2014534.1 zincin [Aaosphaeria arxii CBS 175.79]